MTEDQSIQSQGGAARAKSLSKEQRSEIARNAAVTRHMKNSSIPDATHGSPDHPLRIGDLEIPCFVLNSSKRVITQGGMLTALTMRSGGATKGGGDRLSNFITTKAINPFISNDLRERITNPIKFRAQGSLAYGYEAIILTEICDAVLDARAQGALDPQQKHIAKQAEILVRAFAKVGIIALIDEATGYQYERPRRELEEQLRKFLSEDLRKYAETFPSDYFKELCRLRGVELRSDMKLPQYFGVLTNNLVYRRIAPGLLKKLKERKGERGKPSNKLFSWLSEDIGLRALLVHLGQVVGLMKVNVDYEAFERQLDKIAPVYAEVPGLFDNPKDWEDPGN